MIKKISKLYSIRNSNVRHIYSPSSRCTEYLHEISVAIDNFVKPRRGLA